MDTQLFLQGQTQLDFLPEINSFHHGSFSDDESDTSSPCSSNDSLDFLSFEIPEIFIPEDFEPLTLQSAVSETKALSHFDEHLTPIPCLQDDGNTFPYQFNDSSTLEQNVNQSYHQGLHPMVQGGSQTTPPPSCMLSDSTNLTNLPGQQSFHHINDNMTSSHTVDGSLIYHKNTNALSMHQGLLFESGRDSTNSSFRTDDSGSLSTTKEKNNKKVQPTKGFDHTLRKRCIPDQMKDEKYWKRRLRNNWSAKKSREAKRAKDSFIHNKISFLENENRNLKMTIARLLADQKSKEYNNRSAWTYSNQLM